MVHVLNHSPLVHQIQHLQRGSTGPEGTGRAALASPDAAAGAEAGDLSSTPISEASGLMGS